MLRNCRWTSRGRSGGYEVVLGRMEVGRTSEEINGFLPLLYV